eukprot:NODE_444_length_8544_cov_0.465127.p7 type:complete len:145 gc:universal NODE_444_length_8544_cov_0.465127:779-1213(+)
MGKSLYQQHQSKNISKRNKLVFSCGLWIFKDRYKDKILGIYLSRFSINLNSKIFIIKPNINGISSGLLQSSRLKTNSVFKVFSNSDTAHSLPLIMLIKLLIASKNCEVCSIKINLDIKTELLENISWFCMHSSVQSSTTFRALP